MLKAMGNCVLRLHGNRTVYYPRWTDEVPATDPSGPVILNKEVRGLIKRTLPSNEEEKSFNSKQKKPGRSQDAGKNMHRQSGAVIGPLSPRTLYPAWTR